MDKDRFMEGNGYLPPQNVELEEVVLGALLLEKDAMIQSGDYIHADSFYKPAHRDIFEKGIAPLFAKNDSIDIMTVINELKDAGVLDRVGGAYYISQLTNRVASSANIRSHIDILNNLTIKRNVIALASKMTRDAYDDTVLAKDLLDTSAKEFDKIGSKVGSNTFQNMHQVVGDGIREIEAAGDHEGNVTGIPTGYSHLDRVTGGWQLSDLIIIAARPGMGKTMYILNLARNAAVNFGVEIAIFSLEMAAVQLGKRLISNISGISHDKIKRGKLTTEEWDIVNTKVKPLIDSHIYIDDQSNISVYQLKAKARRLKHERPGLKMIIIDYIQLMTAGTGFKGNRDQEIGFITRNLKGIAKDMNIPVIALSQLSRAVETRGGNKKPMLSDLRESGSIEQDADMVQFLYRPEYYGFTEDEGGNSTINKLEIIIAKHRSGSLENVLLGVDLSRSRVLNLGDLYSNMGSTPDGDMFTEHDNNGDSFL